MGYVVKFSSKTGRGIRPFANQALVGSLDYHEEPWIMTDFRLILEGR